jgi:hypothetical protein
VEKWNLVRLFSSNSAAKAQLLLKVQRDPNAHIHVLEESWLWRYVTDLPADNMFATEIHEM